VQIRPYRPADEAAVIGLWTGCGLVRAWNDPKKDIQRKLAVQPELFLVGELDGTIVATAIAGFDGHRGWVYYLAVAQSQQRKGLGRAMMERVEVLLRDMGCPKLNLQVRSSNDAVLAFYEKLGYSREERVSMGRRLIVDEPGSR
jgi:ribosomal protein S18 acetylase RimI-like enzyme